MGNLNLQMFGSILESKIVSSLSNVTVLDFREKITMVVYDLFDCDSNYARVVRSVGWNKRLARNTEETKMNFGNSSEFF